MKYSLQEEKRLLTLLEGEDEGYGVSFSDHAYVEANNYVGDTKEKFLANHNLTPAIEYHLTQMHQRGFVDIRNKYPEFSDIHLLPKGHDRLIWHRDQVWSQKLKRLVSTAFDRAFASIVTPIVVSVLTVIVMNILGLTGGTSP